VSEVQRVINIQRLPRVLAVFVKETKGLEFGRCGKRVVFRANEGFSSYSAKLRQSETRSILGVARESFFLLFVHQKYGILGNWSPASLSHKSVVCLKGLSYGAVIFSSKCIKHFSIV
jgi:hypothetical protein